MKKYYDLPIKLAVFW